MVIPRFLREEWCHALVSQDTELRLADGDALPPSCLLGAEVWLHQTTAVGEEMVSWGWRHVDTVILVVVQGEQAFVPAGSFASDS